MSRIDEPVDPGSVAFSARLTVDAHTAGQPCQCCTADGCRQLDWARKALAGRHHQPSQPTTGHNQRPTEHRGANMDQIKWRTLRCDNSGPNCPQIATEGDTVYLRDSENPMDIAVFPAASWETLKQKVRDGEV